MSENSIEKNPRQKPFFLASDTNGIQHQSVASYAKVERFQL